MEMNVKYHGCTGNGNIIQDACGGDSAGPLVIRGNSKNLLVGVVSFGSACGRDRSPKGIYAKVSAYKPFIRQVMSTNSI